MSEPRVSDARIECLRRRIAAASVGVMFSWELGEHEGSDRVTGEIAGEPMLDLLADYADARTKLAACERERDALRDGVAKLREALVALAHGEHSGRSFANGILSDTAALLASDAAKEK